MVWSQGEGGVVWSQGEGVEWCGAKVRGWSGVEPR